MSEGAYVLYSSVCAVSHYIAHSHWSFLFRFLNMAYYRRRSFRKRTFRRSRRFNRRRRFARKRRYGRKRMRFTGRPRRWRFVRNAAIQSKGASYLDSLRDWAHERGRHLVGAGLVPALGAAAYSYIDREMKARMPWLQGYYYPPHATDLVLPPQVQAPRADRVQTPDLGRSVETALNAMQAKEDITMSAAQREILKQQAENLKSQNDKVKLENSIMLYDFLKAQNLGISTKDQGGVVGGAKFGLNLVSKMLGIDGEVVVNGHKLTFLEKLTRKFDGNEDEFKKKVDEMKRKNPKDVFIETTTK